MTSSAEAAARIHAIEALQDDLLRQLDELERKSAAVLAAQLPRIAACPDQEDSRAGEPTAGESAGEGQPEAA